MKEPNTTTLRSTLATAKAVLMWALLMTVGGSFFAIGFAIGMTRVVLGLHEEHRKFADLAKLAKDELGYMRIAAGLPNSANVSREDIA